MSDEDEIGICQPLPWSWQLGPDGDIYDAVGERVVLHGRSPRAAANRSALAAALSTLTPQVSPERHMEEHLSQRRIDSFNFLVEQWQGERVEEVLAGAGNLFIAKAAYNEAVAQRPKATLTLKQGAHVMEEHKP